MGWTMKIICLMSVLSKPKICSSHLVTNRWTCSSLFNVQKMTFEFISSLVLALTPTLASLINVPVRLLILPQKWAKNGQNVAFLCNKSPKFHPYMLLLEAVRLLERLEYLDLLEIWQNGVRLIPANCQWNIQMIQYGKSVILKIPLNSYFLLKF